MRSTYKKQNRDLLKFTSDESIEKAAAFAEAIVRADDKAGGDWSPIRHVAETMLYLKKSREFWKSLDMDKARVKAKRQNPI